MTANTPSAVLHGPGLTDVRGMVLAHDAFRRVLRPVPALIREVPDGYLARVRLLADHLELVLNMLTHHHEGEDELLWPTLLARVPDELAPLVHLMESQHEGVHGMLEEVGTRLPRWRKDPTRPAGARLADRVEHLVVLLDEHMQAEEQHVLPIATRTVTQAEWDALGERGVKGIPLSKGPLIFGIFMEVGDPEVVADELAKAPAPVRLLLRLTARRAWRRYRTRLFGA